MQTHKTVMLTEAVASLELHKDSRVVDATFGAGGHAEEILKQLGSEGIYIGIDVDPTALTKELANPSGADVHLVNENFKNLSSILGSLHINSVDAILADLGWRMEQFADGERGLSFQNDGPLTMAYGDPEKYSFTAKDIVNEWEEAVLADILYGYGEERAARRIARAIVQRRAEKPIETTFELKEVVESVIPKRFNVKAHPATKTFQAIRIAVNDELQVLESFLKDAFASLSTNGRLAVITFHSLEDRIVKHYFRTIAESGMGTLLQRKPFTPTEEEVSQNPRARSAKLRVLQKNNVEQHEQDTTNTNSV